ncbi:YlbD family protein [Alkalihalobacillus trypoxylicola]|uniref:Uncharacterized protein n=1 Tax=Alkalihalobacillus trypoxylicola TaxID=519424 RepID=A0A161PMC7_9BACI|nr:YlbD family protein [Alkalihalobacillus trypoxylicola]KYG35203.1 hypothetical protein AZF04_02365 [Alkalihalobacillus trypoxylicola]
MSKNKLNPSVQQFKEFVKVHPGIVEAIQSNQKTLQQFYEEWTILGDSHEQWGPYKPTLNVEEPTNQSESEGSSFNSESNQSQSEASSGETLQQLVSMFKKMNINDLQNHLGQFSSFLGNVQNVIQTFQKPSSSSGSNSTDRSFSFRKD